jgi:hypothetical protein
VAFKSLNLEKKQKQAITTTKTSVIHPTEMGSRELSGLSCLLHNFSPHHMSSGLKEASDKLKNVPSHLSRASGALLVGVKLVQIALHWRLIDHEKTGNE